MKYQLLPLDPDLDPIDFDTQNILDLARLGPYDKDAGVVYFDGVACLEPRPDKTTMTYVRNLEAEALALATERNALRDRLTSLAALIEGVADDDIECPFCLVVGDRDHRANCLVNVARAAANEAQS